jgi:hypothetical protein
LPSLACFCGFSKSEANSHGHACGLADRMNDDPDIHRAAMYMIHLHGERALAAARNHANALRSEHQVYAAALWRQITDAVAELLRR